MAMAGNRPQLPSTNTLDTEDSYPAQQLVQVAFGTPRQGDQKKLRAGTGGSSTAGGTPNTAASSAAESADTAIGACASFQHVGGRRAAGAAAAVADQVGRRPDAGAQPQGCCL